MSSMTWPALMLVSIVTVRASCFVSLVRTNSPPARRRVSVAYSRRRFFMSETLRASDFFSGLRARHASVQRRDSASSVVRGRNS